MKFSYVYLLFFVTTCSLRSMEPSRASCPRPCAQKPWRSMEIHVKSFDATFTINDQTTVEDIKKEFLNIEGIPVHQQTLHAVILGGRLYKVNPCPLYNNDKIKDIMNANKTNTFELSLDLHPLNSW